MNCTCGHDREYHGNADGQTGWQARCGSPDCDCEDYERDPFAPGSRVDVFTVPGGYVIAATSTRADARHPMTVGAERPRLTADGGGTDDNYDPACLEMGHLEVTTYEDDEVWQGECSRCGAELWSEKDES